MCTSKDKFSLSFSEGDRPDFYSQLLGVAYLNRHGSINPSKPVSVNESHAAACSGSRCPRAYELCEGPQEKLEDQLNSLNTQIQSITQLVNDTSLFEAQQGDVPYKVGRSPVQEHSSFPDCLEELCFDQILYDSTGLSAPARGEDRAAGVIGPYAKNESYPSQLPSNYMLRSRMDAAVGGTSSESSQSNFSSIHSSSKEPKSKNSVKSVASDDDFPSPMDGENNVHPHSDPRHVPFSTDETQNFSSNKALESYDAHDSAGSPPYPDSFSHSDHLKTVFSSSLDTQYDTDIKDDAFPVSNCQKLGKYASQPFLSSSSFHCCSPATAQSAPPCGLTAASETSRIDSLCLPNFPDTVPNSIASLRQPVSFQVQDGQPLLHRSDLSDTKNNSPVMSESASEDGRSLLYSTTQSSSTDSNFSIKLNNDIDEMIVTGGSRSRRRESQNRASRNYRLRKKAHLKNIEEKLKQLQFENETLRQENNKIRAHLKEKQKVCRVNDALVSSDSKSPSSVKPPFPQRSYSGELLTQDLKTELLIIEIEKMSQTEQPDPASLSRKLQHLQELMARRQHLLNEQMIQLMNPKMQDRLVRLEGFSSDVIEEEQMQNLTNQLEKIISKDQIIQLNNLKKYHYEQRTQIWLQRQKIVTIIRKFYQDRIIDNSTSKHDMDDQSVVQLNTQLDLLKKNLNLEVELNQNSVKAFSIILTQTQQAKVLAEQYRHYKKKMANIQVLANVWALLIGNTC
ncbi:uncharacterized protein LOC126318193 [Schistocerca gregaria]|uniref:uncharacterized protein LOC126318193 n=1 Tax=Schistocerca gregaria TaxID=7010 RepID=UPI00211F196F|nr:uncharacterized protein LOC126318193 [Schistocerca gregaria]